MSPISKSRTEKLCARQVELLKSGNTNPRKKMFWTVAFKRITMTKQMVRKRKKRSMKTKSTLMKKSRINGQK